MSFSRSLALLIAFTVEFWQYGDSCVRQKYAKNVSNRHYERLLKIDTGYSQEESLKWYANLKKTEGRGDAINGVYGNLLCGYMYNCSHYMNLIRPLLTNTNRTDASLNEPLVIGSFADFDFDFGDQVVGMLNVLYNFGLINFSRNLVHHLWLVYMYASGLRPLLVDRTLNENERHGVLLEHNNVYAQLVQLTSRYCTSVGNNVYNDEYDQSVYYKCPGENHGNPISLEVIKSSVVDLKNRIDARIDEITKSMNIDNCTGYLRFNHLRVIPYVDDSVLRKLLKDFAEITSAAEQDRIFRLIKGTYTRSLNVESFGTTSLCKHFAGCQDMFMNAMKFVMFFHSWKHVVQISKRLTDSSWPTHEFAIEQIKKSNRKMYEYFITIVAILNLEEDRQLRTIAKLFDPSSADKLANKIENQQLGRTILAQLLEINTKYFQLPSDHFSIGKFTPTYLKERKHELYNTIGNIFFMQHNLYILESQLSFQIFRTFVKDSFENIDFQVISSFNDFLEYKKLQETLVYV